MCRPENKMGWLGVVVCFALIVIAPAVVWKQVQNRGSAMTRSSGDADMLGTDVSVWPHYYHCHRENGPSSPIPNDSPNWGKWTSPGEKELGAGAPGTDPDQPGAAAS